MADSGRKLFLGGRLRRLRRDLGQSQAQMAEELRISASYLNLLERNQRPVTTQVLLRLVETYDIDLRSLTADGQDGGSNLEEVLADRLFADLSISRHEIAEAAEAAPGVTDAFIRLYRAYLERGRLIDLGAFDRDRRAPREAIEPTEWVRDLVGAQRNHFPELEQHAESLLAALAVEPQDLASAVQQRLKAVHGIQCRVMPIEVMGGLLRRYDHHRRRLMLSETLAPAGRLFGMCYQLALLEHGADVKALADRFAPPDGTCLRLLKVFLVNYLAAAQMMPYERFLSAMEASAYDIERVRPRFGVSFEQAAHRLTSLGRQGTRGIPFFMVRIDAAGNISKRYAAETFPFSRFGGTCPRWNVHDCFRTPGRILTQIVETPDGQRYFTVSRTVRRVSGLLTSQDDELVVGLGCDLRYASKLRYARGLDLSEPLVVEIGPSCRICERSACPQRAAAPITKNLIIDEASKSLAPFPFGR